MLGLSQIIYWTTRYRRFRFSRKQILNRLHYQISSKKNFLKYRPLWLHFYVSDLCNLRCKMCPHHTPGDATDFTFFKKEQGVMAPEDFETIIRKFPESILIMFAGVGEPLINKHLLDMTDVAARENKMINLVTNGVLLTEDKMRRIVANRHFNQVSISLNASNPEDYQKICNMPERVFNVVVKNIKTLVQMKKGIGAKFDIIVSAVCSETFMDKVKNFLIFCDNLGVDRIDIHNYINFSIKEKESQWSPISSSQSTEQKIKELAQFSKENIRAKVNLPLVLKTENFSKKCDWFFKNLCFDAHGNIGSCGRVMSPQATYGNILKSPKDVWNNRYMRAMRSAFIKNEKHLPGCCYECVENF